MQVTVNGQHRDIDGLSSGDSLLAVIEAMDLKADRIAVEYDGAIVRRTAWEATAVTEGARLEIVHFVGGGTR